LSGPPLLVFLFALGFSTKMVFSLRRTLPIPSNLKFNTFSHWVPSPPFFLASDRAPPSCQQWFYFFSPHVDRPRLTNPSVLFFRMAFPLAPDTFSFFLLWPSSSSPQHFSPLPPTKPFLFPNTGSSTHSKGYPAVDSFVLYRQDKNPPSLFPICGFFSTMCSQFFSEKSSILISRTPPFPPASFPNISQPSFFHDLLFGKKYWILFLMGFFFTPSSGFSRRYTVSESPPLCDFFLVEFPLSV